MSEPLCPEHDKRAAMTDDEFWAYVFPQPPEPTIWDDDGPGMDQACEVCGESGACGYDAEGRPMIHTDPVDTPEGTP